MMDEKDLDLLLEALRHRRIDLRESLDNYTKAAKVTNYSEPDFVEYLKKKIASLDSLYERIFTNRYKIEIG